MNDMLIGQKLGLTIEEAAAVSGISRSRLFEAIRAGALPRRKNGRNTIILRHELVDWMCRLPKAEPTD